MSINTVVKNLQSNNMEAYYVQSPAEAVALVKALIPAGAVTASGGSVTLKQTGIYDLITSKEYNYADRFADSHDSVRKAFCADWFLLSANAITEDGLLYNVDGNANRVSALTFGPDNVIVVAGTNKIVPALQDAVRRVKTISAPLNAKRLSCDTYCARTGHCISLENPNSCMADGCKSAARICCSYVITGMQRIKNRIKVIIIEGEYGL